MRRGFTLLEVVLALSLAVLLLGASMTFLWELADRRSTLARGTRDLHAAVVLVERLEADLAAGLAGDDGIGAGIEGTETKLKLLTRGVWLAPAGANAGTPVAGGAGEGDLQASEYQFDPTAGRVSARRFVVKPGAPGGGGDMELVSDRVERLRFRYYDGRAWRTSFDSKAAGDLPVAIEVAVWFTSLKNPTAPPMETSATTGEAEGINTAAPTDASGSFGDTDRRWPAPDRLRIIIVPDGPVSSSKEGA
jgi:prepilin-type N-terminal cleavage/methylation domain-containing protein